MSTHLTRRAALATALLGAAVLTASAAPAAEVVVRHQRKPGEVYARRVITGSEVIALSWVHSVDHTPWTEFYTIAGNELLLDCTELELTGAGTPYQAPRVERHGSKTRLCGLDKRFSEVRWIHSHAVNYRIDIDSQPWLATVDIPHHVPAEMLLTRKRPRP